MGKMQITIPEPCHESWDKMTQAEKGKFCGSCQKVVVDFSKMSDAELIAYFKKPKDSVCGRFKEDQLNRVMAPPPKRLPWIKYFFQIAIPAFLFSIKASSQQRTVGKVAVKECSKDTKDTLHQNPVGIQLGGVALIEQETFKKIKTVTGKVTDESGVPIAYASVVVKGTKIGVMCDSIGNFKINNIEHGAILSITAVGFEAKEIEATDQPMTVIIQASKYDLLGVVVVTRKTKKQIEKEKIKAVERPKTTDVKEIKLYPNPALAGSDIVLEWKEAIGGEYELQFISEAGVIVQRSHLEILHKAVKTTIRLPELNKGVHIVVMINKRTKASYTSKLLIE